MPAASSKSERVFSAAGNTVTPKRANLNPEKVEECVIVRCNLRLLKSMGLLETSVHVHLFIYSCSKNDEKMILCARVYRNCHSICWITHPRRCFIAFKMKCYYPGPSHFQFSGRDRSGTWKKVRDGSGTGIPSDPGHMHACASFVVNFYCFDSSELSLALSGALKGRLPWEKIKTFHSYLPRSKAGVA